MEKKTVKKKTIKKLYKVDDTFEFNGYEFKVLATWNQDDKQIVKFEIK